MLADLLKLLRIRAEVYHNAKVCGNWLIKEWHLGQTCFHMPTEGECLLLLPDQSPLKLHAGDLVIFPRESPHTMKPIHAGGGAQRHLPYRGAPSDGVGLLCGRLHFQHAVHNLLLDALPSPLVITAAQAVEWLPSLLDLILKESYSDRPNPVMLDRLCELIFIYALQFYSNRSHANAGVFKLYGTEKLAPAITAIHQEPAQNWTLERLAERCHMSRSAFASLFKQAGWTPMRYLAWWRMQLAYQLLQGGKTLAQTAAAIGYQSEPAFSRAFQKEFSVSPGQFRRKKR